MSIGIEGQQRVGILAEIPDILRDFGVDPAPILAKAGVAPDLLRNPENALTFIQTGDLLQACVDATGCGHFGILVGQRSTMNSLGLVGRLMRNAPTLGDAILDLCVNQARYVRGSAVYLLVQDGIAMWGYGVHYPGMQASAQLSQGAVAAGCNFLKELVGLLPDEVHLSCPDPADPGAYRSCFGVAPQFNAEQFALVIPASLLSHPIRGADPTLRKLLEKSVQAYWAIQEPSVSEQIARILRAQVLLPKPSLAQAASRLTIHPRTLNRRLQAEGTSFRTLLNAARLETARQLLAGTRIPVTDIAFAIGYADASGFSHAFQRWSGITPSDWRKRA